MGWQHLVNGFVNPYLVKQNLNLFLIFLLSKWYIVFLPGGLTADVGSFTHAFAATSDPSNPILPSQVSSAAGSEERFLHEADIDDI